MFREAGEGEGAGGGGAMGRWGNDFDGFGLEEITAVTGDPDLGGFAGQDAGDEADFPVQSPEAAPAVGEAVDKER